MRACAWVVGVVLVSGGCQRTPTSNAPRDATPTETPAPLAASSVAASVPSGPAAIVPPPIAPAAPVDWTRAPYPWLADAGPGQGAPTDALQARFAPPAGFTRVEVAKESFGAWLRGLPLTAPDTPVRTHRGQVLHEATDPRIAAVAAIDVGSADLQQCADSIMRMFGEWRWSQGDHAVSFRAASGTAMPYARWARGERVVNKGAAIEWAQTGSARDDHPAFRKYLDAVFTWANTGSLARDARPTDLAQLRPGDFFVMPGNPGHAVLVLDLARADDGRRAVLLGQGFMPAQSFHILKAPTGQAWFLVEPAQGALTTPFWEPFPWSSLRRLDG